MLAALLALFLFQAQVVLDAPPPAALPSPAPAARLSPDQRTAEVAEAAVAALAERFPDDAHRLEVRVTRSGGTWDAQAPLRLRFKATTDGLPRAHTQVDVLTGTDETGWDKTGWATLFVAHYDSVVVTRQALRTDAAVPQEAVGHAFVETTRFRGTPLHPAAWRALQQQGTPHARRSVGEGRMLRDGDLRPPYAVLTGNTVSIRYLRGRIRMNLTGQARQAGFVGQEIRVLSSGLDKTYLVRITGPSQGVWIATLP